MSKNIYREAAKRKLRFPSERGLLTVETLFTLPLTSKTGISLDGLAQEIDAQILAQPKRSFVGNASTSPQLDELQLKLAILVDVIEELEQEQKERASLEARRTEARRLRVALAAKKQSELENMNTEEIEARLKTLEAEGA